MANLPGMEKFSHLEDKIYLTIEFAKKMREEKERLERETNSLRHEVSSLLSEKMRLEQRITVRARRDSTENRSDARSDHRPRTRSGKGAARLNQQAMNPNKQNNPGGAAQSIRVEIYNQTYNIRSDGDNEYIMRLAEYVDGKMREISSGTLTVDSLKVAILAALHIADEYHRLKIQQEQIDQQLASRSAECAEMLDRVLKQKESAPQEFETEQ